MQQELSRMKRKKEEEMEGSRILIKKVQEETFRAVSRFQEDKT